MAIAKAAIPKLPEYGEKELSLLGWAFGKAHAKAWPLFDALAVRSAAECLDALAVRSAAECR